MFIRHSAIKRSSEFDLLAFVGVDWRPEPVRNDGRKPANLPPILQNCGIA